VALSPCSSQNIEGIYCVFLHLIFTKVEFVFLCFETVNTKYHEEIRVTGLKAIPKTVRRRIMSTNRAGCRLNCTPKSLYDERSRINPDTHGYLLISITFSIVFQKRQRTKPMSRRTLPGSKSSKKPRYVSGPESHTKPVMLAIRQKNSSKI